MASLPQAAAPPVLTGSREDTGRDGAGAEQLHGRARHDGRQRFDPAHRRQLGISIDQGTWVITSYAVAEAMSVPLTGWLASGSARCGCMPCA
jgi:DHA2 family multidrug resistance protein